MQAIHQVIKNVKAFAMKCCPFFSFLYNDVCAAEIQEGQERKGGSV